MKILHIFFVVLFAVGMGAGQLLLKYSAHRQAAYSQQPLVSRLIALMQDWPFILGAFSYGILLIFWIWILTFVPVSKAYPFTSLSIAVVTVGGWLCFGEEASVRCIIGVGVVMLGLIILGTE